MGEKIFVVEGDDRKIVALICIAADKIVYTEKGLPEVLSPRFLCREYDAGRDANPEYDDLLTTFARVPSTVLRNKNPTFVLCEKSVPFGVLRVESLNRSLYFINVTGGFVLGRLDDISSLEMST